MKKIYCLATLLMCLSLSACFTMMSPEGRDSQLAMKAKPSATLIIHRAGSVWGSARTTPIYVNGKFIGRLATGATLDYKVKPGKVIVETSKVTVALSDKYNKKIQFNALAGKKYNIEVTVPAQIDLLGPVTDLAFNLELKS